MTKWILIEVDNHYIEEPTIFNTHEEAYREMERRWYDFEPTNGRYNYIDEDCATIETDILNIDWRIFEVTI